MISLFCTTIKNFPDSDWRSQCDEGEKVNEKKNVAQKETKRKKKHKLQLQKSRIRM